MPTVITNLFTNLVSIVLLNVSADSIVEWSNDLKSWQPYACTYQTVPRWEIQITNGPPKMFWRYIRYYPENPPWSRNLSDPEWKYPVFRMRSDNHLPSIDNRNGLRNT